MCLIVSYLILKVHLLTYNKGEGSTSKREKNEMPWEAEKWKGGGEEGKERRGTDREG